MNPGTMAVQLPRGRNGGAASHVFAADWATIEFTPGTTLNLFFGPGPSVTTETRRPQRRESHSPIRLALSPIDARHLHDGAHTSTPLWTRGPPIRSEAPPFIDQRAPNACCQPPITGGAAGSSSQRWYRGHRGQPLCARSTWKRRRSWMSAGKRPGRRMSNGTPPGPPRPVVTESQSSTSTRPRCGGGRRCSMVGSHPCLAPSEGQASRKQGEAAPQPRFYGGRRSRCGKRSAP